jgi:hypothetical protein
MADEPTGTPETTTATPTGDGSVAGDGGSGVEETPEQLRARLADMERIHQQDLSRLSAGEEATRRAEAAERQLEIERQGRAYQPPTGVDPELVQFQQDYQDLASRDEVAARLLTRIGAAAEQRAQQAERKSAYDREMVSVPSELREDVERRMKATPGLSPSWAQKEAEAEMYRKERATLDASRKQLDDEEAARKRGRVDQSVTGIPGSDLRTDSMTPEQYERDCLAAESGDRKALQRLKDYDAGRIKLKSG